MTRWPNGRKSLSLALAAGALWCVFWTAYSWSGHDGLRHSTAEFVEAFKAHDYDALMAASNAQTSFQHRIETASFWGIDVSIGVVLALIAGYAVYRLFKKL